MDWISIITGTIKMSILPPAFNLWLLLLGWLLWRRWRRLAIGSLILSGVSLYVMSMPIVGLWLASMLQSYPALSPEQIKNPVPDAAIVILGGGRRENAPEFDGADQVSSATMTRLIYGAYLHKQTNLPILVSGGRVFMEKRAEAELMAEMLAEYFQIAPRWQEDGSRNTEANAYNTIALLRQEKINTIYLVTHAWHMPRAMIVFSRTDINVIPAPTSFIISPKTSRGPMPWLPSVMGLATVRTVFHEYLGMLWYSMRAQLGMTDHS